MTVHVGAARPARDVGDPEAGGIRITRAGTRSALSPAAIEALRAEFAARHCVHLRGLLGRDILGSLLDRLERATFVERRHEGIDSNLELWMPDPGLTGVLHVLVSSRVLLDLVEAVSGSPRLGSFQGRVYRVSPARGHHDAWHSDMIDGRLVAMSVNLSPEPFEGGVLQIRERDSHRLVHEVANTGPGDAIVFRLSHALQHRITEVEGRASKTAFAGWFRAEPDVATLLRRPRPTA